MSSTAPSATRGASTTVTARNNRTRVADACSIGSSEERVDERCDRAALGEDDHHPQQEQDHHQREQPPLLLLAEELEVLPEDAELGHAAGHTSTSARTVLPLPARGAPSRSRRRGRAGARESACRSAAPADSAGPAPRRRPR